MVVSSTSFFGRKKTLILAFHLCSFSYLVAWLKEKSTILLNITEAIYASLDPLLFYYSNEIFPTVLRTKGFGICFSVYRLTSIIASVEFLFDIYDKLPEMILVLTIVSSMLSFFLTETVNTPIKNNLPEMLGEKINDEGFN